MKSESVIQFGVLGTLDVQRDCRSVDIPAVKQRIILATLLLRINEFVSHDQLIERIWHTGVPNDARGALHTHVSRLRHALSDDRRSEDQLIRSHREGYALALAPGDLDLSRFRELTTRAASDSVQGVDLLGRALALWRGPALADVQSESLHHDDVPLLNEERLVAMERLMHLRLQLGRYEETIVPLKAMTAEHPFRERLWAHLMAALFMSGRRAEALDTYQRAVTLLREELGVDPDQQLVRLQSAILADESTRLLDELLLRPRLQVITPPSGQESRQRGKPLAHPPPVDPPRQLPSDLSYFTGRAEQLQDLDDLLEQYGGAPSQPIMIATITGMGGIGKTTLAIHWAHRVIHHFPEGVLYLNLRGFSPSSPLEPDNALEMLLHTLGVPTTSIPDQTDARSALLRSLLAHRRVLIILDNARDAAQVRPLLPGSHAFVLITSRNRLRGLVVREGAHRISLEPYSASESTTLLGTILGGERVAAEPQSAAELARFCAHLPLALTIAAEHIDRSSHGGLRDFAEKMIDESTRLDVLTTADDPEASLRAVLSWSFHALEPWASHVFRLLNLRSNAEFGPREAAAMVGTTCQEAEQLLELLVDRSLLERVGRDGFRFHDFIHMYAATRARHNDNPQQAIAIRRFQDWYLRTAGLAGELTH